MADGPKGNKTIDFVLCDGAAPNATQYELGFQTFPFIVTTMAAQINFGFKQDIVLTGTVLADIYLGKITNWRDPAILATNPNVTMPNATILVFYRSDVTPATSLWTSALSTWSSEWNTTWGRSTQIFPTPLRALPNFYGFPDLVSLNGAVAGTLNSIGYAQFYSIARDPSLHYVRLINSVSLQPIGAWGFGAGADYITINKNLNGALKIDPPSEHAWPIIAIVDLMVSTKPENCEKAREVFKFIRWAITDKYPRHTTLKLGGVPLGTNLTNLVLTALNNITCDGESIGYYEEDVARNGIDYFFFAISNLALLLALILSGLHIYHFRTSLINLIYSTIFVVGTLLTLLSPIFWAIIPKEDTYCQARVWTTSLGFSILLGTMFSRTWQLQDIYQLQKHANGMDALKRKVATNTTYIQLAITLIGVIFTNFLLLVIWSAVDPFRAHFHISDEVQLTGYWSCTCNNMIPWLTLELIFFLSVLCFGVYVIYNTWSFQRRALLTETRWVLLALYNVILNIFALIPMLSFVDLNDRTLSLIVMVSIDLSAGSIVCAVLLPRVLENFKFSKSSRNGTTAHMPSSKRECSIQVDKLNKPTSKRRPSRTPDDVLAKRLEDPQPLKAGDKWHENQIEMQSYQTTPLQAHAEISSSALDISHNIPAEGSPLVRHEQIAEEPSPTADDIDSPSLHPLQNGDTLTWSENPLKPRDRDDTL
eukprot:TRINITY_DN2950_c0_g1_i14.p1 TRINITY_DN2950_c0_g1~~TRINITY_DN2950_c0_g1_i14.p1  ORF type:complete len:808 (-),score=63.28 TRINITY_DN2950_c0_g1_i14:339-2456(-)